LLILILGRVILLDYFRHNFFKLSQTFILTCCREALANARHANASNAHETTLRAAHEFMSS